MTMCVLQRILGSAVLLVILLLAGFSAAVAAEEIGLDGSSQQILTPAMQHDALQQTPASVMPSLPLLFAEGSNSCEIVSCGMGIKQTCQITCPMARPQSVVVIAREVSARCAWITRRTVAATSGANIPQSSFEEHDSDPPTVRLGPSTR